MDPQKSAVLSGPIDIIAANEAKIIARWVGDGDVVEVLTSHAIDAAYFAEHFAHDVLHYFIGVVRGKETIGNCPVIIALLDFFKEKNIATSELYVICIHFRESMVRELLEHRLLDAQIYDAVCFVFDANFRGVLQIYTETVSSARQTARGFQEIIENSLNEIYIFDEETFRFTYVNRGALLNTGYAAETFQAMTPADIKPEFTLQQLRDTTQPLRDQTQEQLLIETIHKRRDGSRYDVEIRMQRMAIEGKAHFVAIANDVTARNRARKEKQRLYALATQDHLTKIINRQQFDLLCVEQIDEARECALPLALIMFDIDHFKRVNDCFGHDAGDRVLIETVQIVRDQIRATDIFARWGGEEFVILLPATEPARALAKAEQLRARIAAHPFETVGPLTCSFGVTALAEFDSPVTFFQRVDGALYQAKEEGRNRVVTTETAR